MSFFRPSRERRGPDPYIAHKMLLFAAGAAFAFAGIATEREWLVYVGVAVLLVGALFRLAALRRRDG